MIHVQLALSCCGVARAEGPIHEAWVEMLSELLYYRLMIVKREEIDNLRLIMVKLTVGCSSWWLMFQISELPAAWSCMLRLPALV